MLRGAGIKAEPALVARGTVAPELLLPGLSAPNHAIVRAEVDGETWWLDPTNPVFVPGFTMPDIQQRWALVIDGAGAVHREDIALASPKGGRPSSATSVSCVTGRPRSVLPSCCRACRRRS